MENDGCAAANATRHRHERTVFEALAAARDDEKARRRPTLIAENHVRSGHSLLSQCARRALRDGVHELPRGCRLDAAALTQRLVNPRADCLSTRHAVVASVRA